MLKTATMKIALSIVVAITVGLALRGLFKPGSIPETSSVPNLTVLSDLPTPFPRVTGPIDLNFPLDHGPHPEYQTEWWYFTGNLNSSDGRQFGFQLTFFRRGLLPSSQQPVRRSDWAASQIYFAHFAVSDIQEDEFYAWERFSRGAAGLAGANVSPAFSVWLEDWSVSQSGIDTFELNASQDNISVSLELQDAKGPILQGQDGYSQKGQDSGNASIYYSLTRLVASGTVISDEAQFTVSGLSWMDHEFSTSALAPGQIGWDWFSIQLDNDTEIMLFYLRREDGTIDQFASGSLVSDNGSTRSLTGTDFQVEVIDHWTSPHSGATYPSGWHIRIPEANLSLDIVPTMHDQELNLSFTYWEGSVTVEGEFGGRPVSGSGYVELTGYAESMAGRF